MLKNMKRIAIMICLQGNTKEFGRMNDYGWKLLKLHFPLFIKFSGSNFKEHYMLLKNLYPIYKILQNRSKMIFSTQSFVLISLNILMDFL